MKLGRCPVCHAAIHLDAAVQDLAARELLALLARNGAVARLLVEYLTLFRPQTRDLSNARALELAGTALELEKDPDILREAMRQALEAAREKQAAGLWKVPKDHGWLKAFIKNARAAQGLPAKPPKARAPEDIPPEQVRARNEKQGGMPENIKKAFMDALNGRGKTPQ